MIIERKAISEDDFLGDSEWISYNGTYYKILGVEANGFLELHNGELLDPDEDFAFEDESDVISSIIDDVLDMDMLIGALGYVDGNELVKDNEQLIFDFFLEAINNNQVMIWDDRILDAYVENTS